jgi:hypothetical protein
MRRADPDELEAAASRISIETLESTRSAIVSCCNEYIRLSELFAAMLEKVPEFELHKFARAFFLCLLGYLPIRPETCPFCRQYGNNRSCNGCDYAITHGRCDSEDSAFSLFIEAFQELGKAIYQETERLRCPPEMARLTLETSIINSSETSKDMLKELERASAFGLMKLKAQYIDRTICLIPQDIFSEEISKKCIEVRKKLKDYW